MEAKKKAIELVNKFKPHADWNNEYGSQEEKANTKHAIQCALICIEEMLKIIPKTKDWKPETKLYMESIGDNPCDFDLPDSDEYNFYQEVKQELLNLK